MRRSHLKFLMPSALVAVILPSIAYAQGESQDTSIFPQWVRTVGDVVQKIWNYPLLTMKDDHELLVGQIVIALLLLLVGIIIARRISRVLAKRLMRVSRIDANLALLVQRILNYGMVGLIVILAMEMVGIPITAFAFLGGALAIGLGFGAQNILNNFISGLILMIERPIRLRDLVEIGEHVGRVDGIGARSTRIRRTDGIDVLVPNSKFLEENVTNWTHSDNRIRTKVSVGVAYGSPTDMVAELICEAVKAQDAVLPEPEPIVVFEEFGDNALLFDVYFWGEIDAPMDLRLLCSQIRFAIDKAFREADITIAFPQRDVHLDTLKPLQVQVQSS